MPLARRLFVRCDFADSLLQGYFDCELSAASVDEFERHLEDCAACASELVELDMLSAELKVTPLYEVAPASLKKRIRASLRPVMQATVMPRQIHSHWLVVAAVLLVFVIAGWGLRSAFRADDYRSELATEMVDAHVHSLELAHLTDIQSNDGPTVSGWFKDKLGFTFPAPDLAKHGFALQGGRVDVVDNRSVAVLVYTRREHPINVFIWPTRERGTSPHTGSLQSYQWIDWRKGKVEFCAISEVSAADIQQLQQLFIE
jgi:anti-sigma factor RsiW